MGCKRRIDEILYGISKNEDLSRADGSTVIMKELWKKLRDTHKLRVVK